MNISGSFNIFNKQKTAVNFAVFFLFLFIFFSSTPQVFASGFIPKHRSLYVPQEGKTFFFVGQDLNTINEYVQKTGQVQPGGVMYYTSVQRMEGVLSAINIGAGPQYGDGLLKQYPDSAIQLGLYMVKALDDVVKGRYDENLKILADWLIKSKRPVFLRIGYEFDNPFENNYDPKSYIKAYRHIVDFLRKKGVTNTAYVWHSYTAAKMLHTWIEWYPGDSYVDWFACSIFSTGNIPYAQKFLKLAKKHHKPFMIAESSPMGMYTIPGKKDWFSHVFRFIHQNDIQAFCYIDSNWDALPMYQGQHWGDQRVEHYPAILKIWQDEIKNSRYIKLFKEF